ncbi:hypothetical protein J587_2621 [Acinetobacter baumannii 144107]|uniref:hypothetical protein n=3 Tax=Acinetobacter baumannii TaxID=470 RepID=UPI000449E2E6|nr:hypothetical protein [Acinetobacter baumannii]EIB6894444.1 hypothetical protein [Acinetobacter baumannii]EKV0481772.1 hypothetical protein [Acinetobacter baumannii]EKW6895350.1 hypothetical protein [Acinetobacter baumannii]ELB2462335.1 hypothetical protein [Acinetobacter baumannii]EXE71954.1 hypothetical protein J587_2621 [Acinetobacter baumannii 144107]
MGNFANLVRKNKIKGPTQKDFNLQVWEAEKKTDNLDKKIYSAGIYFFNQLNKIRNDLDHISSHKVCLSRDNFLKSFISLSNLEFKKLHFLESTNTSTSLIDVQTKKVTKNPLGADITLDELAHACVDSILLNCIHHFNDEKNKIDESISKHAIIDYISSEFKLSQLYDIYSYYWNGVLFEQLDFFTKDNNTFISENTELNIIYKCSHIRDLQINFNDSIHSYSGIEALINNKLFICYDLEKFSYKKFYDLPPRLKTSILTSYSSYFSLKNDFLEKKSTSLNFSFLDIFNVFIQLSSLSYYILEQIRYQNYFDYNKLCPEIDLLELINHLDFINNTDFSSEIIKFISFNPKRKIKADLWRMPIIKLENGKIILCLASLLHPNYSRCLEGWIQEADEKLDEKGQKFEISFRNEIREILQENELLYNDYYVYEPISENITFNEEKYEIDILFRIGNHIFIGEAKCLVSADSPVSNWNIYKSLRKGSSQAIERKNFIIKNIKKFSELLKYKGEISNLKIIPFIVNSNRIFTGLIIDNIPVIDPIIFNQYFKNNNLTILAVNNIVLASLELYKNKAELINNFEKYINYPPTIQTLKDRVKFLDPMLIPTPTSNYENYCYFIRLSFNPVNKVSDLSNIPYKFSKKINTTYNTILNRSLLPFNLN